MKGEALVTIAYLLLLVFVVYPYMVQIVIAIPLQTPVMNFSDTDMTPVPAVAVDVAVAITGQKVWTLDEIRQKINLFTRYEIPMTDYVLTEDILGDYYRHFGTIGNVQAFYDYSTRKMYIDTRISAYKFQSLVTHESCHYLLDNFGCRQMIGSSYNEEENFCDVFSYRLFPDYYPLHDVEYRVHQNNIKCIDNYMSNFIYNCQKSNRFTCDISMGDKAYAN